MENKKRPLPGLVIFAVFTVVTTFVWIGFDVYRTLTKEPSPSVPEEISASLDPTLDTEALAKITQGIYLTEEEIGDTEIVNIDTFQPNVGSPEETPPPEETVAPEETPSPVATEEGELAP